MGYVFRPAFVDPKGGIRIGAKCYPSGFYIRARYVNFHTRDAFQRFHAGCQLGIILNGGTIDICKNRRRKRLQKRQLLTYKSVNTHILQTDGIEHTTGGFNDSRRRIPFGWLQRKSFYNNAAQPIQFNKLREFPRITEGAGCGNHRVLKFDSAKIYF